MKKRFVSPRRVLDRATGKPSSSCLDTSISFSSTLHTRNDWNEGEKNFSSSKWERVRKMKSQLFLLQKVRFVWSDSSIRTVLCVWKGVPSTVNLPIFNNNNYKESNYSRGFTVTETQDDWKVHWNPELKGWSFYPTYFGVTGLSVSTSLTVSITFKIPGKLKFTSSWELLGKGK